MKLTFPKAVLFAGLVMEAAGQKNWCPYPDSLAFPADRLLIRFCLDSTRSVGSMMLGDREVEVSWPLPRKIERKDFDFDGFADMLLTTTSAASNCGHLFLHHPEKRGLEYHGEYCGLMIDSTRHLLVMGSSNGAKEYSVGYFRIIDGRDSVLLGAENVRDTVFIYDGAVRGKDRRVLQTIRGTDEPVWEHCDRYLGKHRRLWEWKNERTGKAE